MRIVRHETTWKILRVDRTGEPCLRLLALRCGYRIGEMCQELRCSERYFRAAFVRDVGISPKRWLREDRMLVARRRLDEGGDPEVVAEELGFACGRTFRREFVAWFRVPPRAWAGRSREG